MHLYIAVRGIKHELERFISALEAQWFYLDKKDEPGGKVLAQLHVRPIQLYEIVFPEPALKEVLMVVQPYPFLSKEAKWADWIRKLTALVGMELEPIPYSMNDLIKMQTPKRPIRKQDIDVVGIGIKRDGDKIVDGQNIHEKL